MSVVLGRGMRHALARAKEGFTLVELMIVVAIVGVLAVLAVYGVRRYIANAKTAEARNSLGQMGKDAVTAFERESMASGVLAPGGSTGIIRKICGNAASTVPSASASIKGQKYQSASTDWAPTADVSSNVGFPCLKFSMDAPQYFMYSYTRTGSGTAAGDTFVASANGDLNGDGTVSTFSTSGSIDSTGRLLQQPSLTETNPEE